ncbi:hypothetical protein ABID37_003630 [Aquamicrobium terrae]|uniref:Uncharacterized protein n=1 Tax=Aquamicrobium terrae TaxID=1324945 RepID=A0ABV2N4Q3_9HYPH
MTGIPLQALLVGDVRPLGPRGIPSGIAKSPIDRPLMLGLLALPVTRRATLGITVAPKKPFITTRSITIPPGLRILASAMFSARPAPLAKTSPQLDYWKMTWPSATSSPSAAPSSR